jgi:hypothetical protein
MGDTGLNLAGLGLVTAGGVLLYSAVNDPVGGPVGVVRDLLRGRTPTPGVRLVTGYLGSPYFLGGTSRKGIDCSGLVLVAYRDGAGISLPHKATLQAARGRRVPRDQARPGDLVAWGVPGNYPHIALVSDSKTCIGAWTWGVPCKYGPIDQKAVPGFGYPDIIRLVG